MDSVNHVILEDSGVTRPDTTAHLNYSTTYKWRVAAANANGLSPWSETWTLKTMAKPNGVNEPIVPMTTLIRSISPNPFNDGASIAFTLSSPDHVTMKIFSMLGEEVATVVSQKFYAGEHVLSWRPNTLSAGRYVVRLFAGMRMESRVVVYVP
jgi:hypothetical protein